MRVVLSAALLLLSALAQAELYKWTDENGRVHFGDRPPGQGPVQRLEAPPPSASKPAIKPPEDSDAERLRRQQQMLRVLDEDRRAKAQQEAQQQAERQKQEQECRQLQQQLRVLAGGRVFSRNEQGGRDYLSGEQIDAQRAQVAAYYRQHCP